MGLDIVEYVMNVEEAFGVMIPDNVAEKIRTPRDLVNYLWGRAFRPRGACLSQRAFYDLRRAVDGRSGLPPRRLRPDTELATLIPPAAWAEVGRTFGHPEWARVRWGGWPGRRMPRTLGDAARQVAIWAAVSVRRPDEEGPTWDEVRAGVVRITRDWLAPRYDIADDALLDSTFLDLSA